MQRSLVSIAMALATLPFASQPSVAASTTAMMLTKSENVQGPTLTGSSSGVTPPKLIHYVAPKYPRNFFGKAVPANVRISLLIGADGVPSDLKVVDSGGEKFDTSALAAVSKYRFQPAEKDAHAVAVRLVVDVTFRPY